MSRYKATCENCEKRCEFVAPLEYYIAACPWFPSREDYIEVDLDWELVEEL